MIALMIYIAIIGLIAWALTTLVPMPPQIQTAVIVVACLWALLLILNAFGLADVAMPRVVR